MSKYVSAKCHLNNTIHLEILCIKDIKLQKYKSVTCKCYKYILCNLHPKKMIVKIKT